MPAENAAPNYAALKERLQANPRTWLVTGVAGFIGSNLLEALLALNQRVVGLDNFATGYHHNLAAAVEDASQSPAWQGRPREELEALFHFIEGDIRDLDTCRRAVEGVETVFHQAALASVARSVEDPLLNNAINVTGTLNLFKGLFGAIDKGRPNAADLDHEHEFVSRLVTA